MAYQRRNAKHEYAPRLLTPLSCPPQTESDVITKKAGTYVPRDKRKLPSADASNGNGVHQAAPAAATPGLAGAAAAAPPASALPSVPPPAAVAAGAPPPAVPQPAGPIGDGGGFCAEHVSPCIPFFFWIVFRTLDG